MTAAAAYAKTSEAVLESAGESSDEAAEEEERGGSEKDDESCDEKITAIKPKEMISHT